jgi:hypothetical protein
MFAGMQKRGFLIGLIGSLLWVSLLTQTGCASIVPPQGGPRDSIPPVLLKTVPGDSATRFSGKKIDFYFDEYIDVQDAFTNVLVSPLPINSPSIDARLRDLSVRLKDSLLPNTTYTIDFGNSIKDFTEGNIAKNLRYIFSTGNFIDSLEIKGKVLLAESGKADSTLIVLLHTDVEDSAVAKKKPSYIAKLDRDGKFHFRNLPSRTFYLYALKDESGMRRYTEKSQLFAFADLPVETSKSKDSITLYAFTAAPATSSYIPTETGKPKTDTDKRLKFQTNLQNSQQDILEPLTFQFDNRITKLDSAGIKLFKDSSYTPIDSFRISLDTSQKVLTFSIPWQEGTSYHLVLTKGAAEDSVGKQWTKTDTLNFTTKRKIDYGKIKIRLRGLNISLLPVLQFFQGDRLIKSFSLTGPLFEEELMAPGEYQLRILLDSNGNGKWDTGQFFEKRKQPERVLPIEKRISIKPNWSNEYEIESGIR